MAVAVVTGALLAGGYVVVQRPMAVSAATATAASAEPTQGAAAGVGSGTPAPVPPSLTASSPAPASGSTAPFNAKLSSTDIPQPDGGVRTGGCSGALIAAQWVITAGHCFHDLRGTRVGGKPDYHMKVAVGRTTDADTRGHVAEVVDIEQSPVNDLALARLNSPITDIRPLALPKEAPRVGEATMFVGWGSLSSKVIVQSDHLKRGEFLVAAVREHEIDLGPATKRTVENTPCPDDSGAPYFVPGPDGEVLVAVEDFGPECPGPGLETAARVDTILAWIREKLGS